MWYRVQLRAMSCASLETNNQVRSIVACEGFGIGSMHKWGQKKKENRKEEIQTTNRMLQPHKALLFLTLHMKSMTHKGVTSPQNKKRHLLFSAHLS